MKGNSDPILWVCGSVAAGTRTGEPALLEGSVQILGPHTLILPYPYPTSCICSVSSEC